MVSVFLLLDGKEYDIYVSYARNAEEEEFVLLTLRGVLENEFGYKLCIFDRDSLPGGSRYFTGVQMMLPLKGKGIFSFGLCVRVIALYWIFNVQFLKLIETSPEIKLYCKIILFNSVYGMKIFSLVIINNSITEMYRFTVE